MKIIHWQRFSKVLNVQIFSCQSIFARAFNAARSRKLKKNQYFSLKQLTGVSQQGLSKKSRKTVSQTPVPESLFNKDTGRHVRTPLKE